MAEQIPDKIPDSILQTVREACGLAHYDNSFDVELIMHVNTSIATLRQNGVGLPIFVTDETKLWSELKDPKQTNGNEMFEMVKTYVFFKTKIFFDPPPPSNVQHVFSAADEMLWRLNLAYDADSKEVINNEQPTTPWS